MQSLVVLSLFLGLCFATSLNSQFDAFLGAQGLPTRAERQGAGPCMSLSCGAAGAGCIGNTLPGCANDCMMAAIACQMNGTDACTCTVNLVECFLNNADPVCVAVSAFVMDSCVQACTENPSLCPPPPSQVTQPLCGAGLVCSNNSVCAAGVAVGGSCEESSQCAPLSIFDNGPECTNGVCVLPGRATGDACSTAANCASGICTSSRCVGKANGAVCSNSNECRFGSYCEGTCMAAVALGGVCMDNNACGTFGVCNNGTCAFLYSMPAGSPCSTSEACLFGTHCGANGMCVANTAAVTCTEDDDCSAVGIDSECACTAAGAHVCLQGAGFSTDCTSTLTSFLTCVQTNGCQESSPFSFSSTSCVALHCANEGACATACYLNSVMAAPYANSGCFAGVPTCQAVTGTTTGGTADDSSAFALSFSASLLLAIAAFFF